MYAYFLRIALPSSLPFVTHIRGHMARTPVPSTLPGRLRFNREKKNVQKQVSFPGVPLRRTGVHSCNLLV